MGIRWFPVAGILLTAFLTDSVSALLLPLANEDPNRFPSAADTQRSDKPPGILTHTVLRLFSDEQDSEALRRRVRTPSPQTAKGPEYPLRSVPFRSTKVSGRATPGPYPLPLTTSAAQMTLKSHPAPPGAEPAEKTLTPGTLKSVAALLSQASPADGLGQKCSRVPELNRTLPVPASFTLKTAVTHESTRQPAEAPPAPTFPALASGQPPRSGRIFRLGSQIFSARRPGHSRSSVTLAPRISLGLTMPNTAAATEAPPSRSPGKARPGTTFRPLAMDSGSSANAVTSSRGPVSRSASELLPLWAATPSQPPPASSSSSSSPAARPLAPPPPSPFSLSPAPVSPITSVSAPSTTHLPGNSSSRVVLTVLQPGTVQGKMHPSLETPAGPGPRPTLSLQHSSHLPTVPGSPGSSWVPEDAGPTLSFMQTHTNRDGTFQDLESTPGNSREVHSVTFKIASKGFSASAWNLTALEHRLLSWPLRRQLQLIYRDAFHSFKRVTALLSRPASAEVNASLVFARPGPWACEILWTLYRRVKASRWQLGYLSLAENSLASDGCTLTDLAMETINISFTVTRPFSPELLLPGSLPFVLLEKEIFQLVTPEVSGFYKVRPQEGPLLFSNMNQWVHVYMEYRFQGPVNTQLRGLASHLAHHLTDPTLQKSSIAANGEKAEIELYEMWLRIPGYPFTKALENKTSPESQELRGQLTRWLTSVLRHLQNFGQVVVEEFLQDPPTARVNAAFLGEAPSHALIQACVRQALRFLQAGGLRVEMVLPDLGTPISRASTGPSRTFPLSFLLVTSLLLLAALYAALPPQSPQQELHTSLLPLPGTSPLCLHVEKMKPPAPDCPVRSLLHPMAGP